MKTLTCTQLGGDCDFVMKAETEKEMSKIAWQHAADEHPEKMENMEDVPQEVKDKGVEYFHKVWQSTPKDSV